MALDSIMKCAFSYSTNCQTQRSAHKLPNSGTTSAPVYSTSTANTNSDLGLLQQLRCLHQSRFWPGLPHKQENTEFLLPRCLLWPNSQQQGVSGRLQAGPCPHRYFCSLLSQLHLLHIHIGSSSVGLQQALVRKLQIKQGVRGWTNSCELSGRMHLTLIVFPRR